MQAHIDADDPGRAGGQPTGSAWSTLRTLLLDPATLLGFCIVVAYVSRIYGYQVTYTSDEAYWMQRTIQFGGALTRGDLSGTYRIGHPGVTVMWTGLAGIGPERLQRFDTPRYSSFSRLERDPQYLATLANARLAVILLASVLVGAAIGLAWKLLGREAGLLGGVFLVLDPYTIGLTRLLHVDALLAPLMAVSALAGLVWWRGGHVGYLLLSAVVGGFALLTKAPAAFLPAFFGVAGLLLAQPWRGPARWLRGVGVWGTIAALVYIAWWPAMWVDPIGTLSNVVTFVIREGGQPHNWSNYFLGQHVTEDPGLLFYPVSLLFRLSPLVLGGVLIALLAGWRRPGDRLVLAALSLYAFGFMAFMTLGEKKFDRYMLPSILTLDLLAGLGAWLLIRRLRPVPARYVAVIAVIALQLWMVWSVQPYPIAFYNPLVGGAAAAERTLMLGWGEGLDQVAHYLNAQPGSNRLIASTLYHHALRPLFRGQTQRIVASMSPDYFVVYVNMEQRQLVPAGIRRLIQDRPPEWTAQVNGFDYAHIYRLPRGVPVNAPGVAPELLPTDGEPEVEPELEDEGNDE